MLSPKPQIPSSYERSPSAAWAAPWGRSMGSFPEGTWRAWGSKFVCVCVSVSVCVCLFRGFVLRASGFNIGGS